MKKLIANILFVFVLLLSPLLAHADNNMDTGGTVSTIQTADNIEVFVANHMLYIKGVDDGVTIEIYSVLGARVMTAKLENGRIDLSDLKKGIYVVRVAKKSVKIMI